jgi:D-erythro-7,8-dihydroneopterin triphosphate epimerase
MAVIRIEDLKLRAIIGIKGWERGNKQDLIVNVIMEYDATNAAKSDKLKDALDYSKIAARITKIVEKSKNLLLEKLAATILKDIMSDKRVLAAAVRLDKPMAIPQAKSVSYEISAER